MAVVKKKNYPTVFLALKLVTKWKKFLWWPIMNLATMTSLLLLSFSFFFLFFFVFSLIWMKRNLYFLIFMIFFFFNLVFKASIPSSRSSCTWIPHLSCTQAPWTLIGPVLSTRQSNWALKHNAHVSSTHILPWYLNFMVTINH